MKTAIVVILAGWATLLIAIAAHGAPIIGGGIVGGSGAAALCGTYQGVGDVKPGAFSFIGMRAYSKATCGTKAIQVCNAADVVCTDMLTDGTTGALIVTNVGAVNCAVVVTCTVKTLYEQAPGGGNGDYVQATIGTRFLFLNDSSDCPNAKPCMYGDPSHYYTNTSPGASVAAPFIYGFVGTRTGRFTTAQAVVSTLNAGCCSYVGWPGSADTAAMWSGGTPIDLAAADGTAHLHGINAYFNGASSVLRVDTTNSSASTPGAGASHTFIGFGGSPDGTSAVSAILYEAVVYSPAASPAVGDLTTIGNNQNAYFTFR